METIFQEQETGSMRGKDIRNIRNRKENGIEHMNTEVITRSSVKRYTELLSNAELFGIERGRYTCFGAYENETKEGIGVLLAEILPSNIQIRIIRVLPAYRRQGVASGLMAAVTNLPEELQLPVYTYGTKEELEEEFLVAMGFQEVQEEYSYIEGVLKDFRKLPMPPKNSNLSIHTIDMVSEKMLVNFLLHAPKDDILQIPEKVPDKNRYSDGSIACMRENRLVAVILVEETDRDITIPYIFGNDREALLYGLAALRQAILEEYSPEVRIRFLQCGERGKEAIFKLLPNGTEEKIHIFKY